MSWEVIVLVISVILLGELFLYLGDIIEHALRLSRLLQLVILGLRQMHILGDN